MVYIASVAQGFSSDFACMPDTSVQIYHLRISYEWLMSLCASLKKHHLHLDISTKNLKRNLSWLDCRLSIARYFIAYVHIKGIPTITLVLGFLAKDVLGQQEYNARLTEYRNMIFAFIYGLPFSQVYLHAQFPINTNGLRNVGINMAIRPPLAPVYGLSSKDSKYRALFLNWSPL